MKMKAVENLGRRDIRDIDEDTAASNVARRDHRQSRM